MRTKSEDAEKGTGGRLGNGRTACAPAGLACEDGRLPQARPTVLWTRWCVADSCLCSVDATQPTLQRADDFCPGPQALIPRGWSQIAESLPPQLPIVCPVSSGIRLEPSRVERRERVRVKVQFRLLSLLRRRLRLLALCCRAFWQGGDGLARRRPRPKLGERLNKTRVVVLPEALVEVVRTRHAQLVCQLRLLELRQQPLEVQRRRLRTSTRTSTARPPKTRVARGGELLQRVRMRHAERG